MRQSGVIFDGTVTAVECEFGKNKLPQTYRIRFQVKQGMRGVGTALTFVLREWAGLWTVGLPPRYRIGERVVLFLYLPSRSRAYQPSRWNQGQATGGGGCGPWRPGVASARVAGQRGPAARRLVSRDREVSFRENLAHPINAHTCGVVGPAHRTGRSGPEWGRVAVRQLERFLPLRLIAPRPLSALSSCVSLAAVWLLLAQTAHAGGPGIVAGASYFDPGVKGAPLVWANNTVTYYSDQGDLSPVLPGPSADALVAEAFVHWTNIPTVALTAAPAGQLAEDVNGTNVTFINGVLNLPADIQPSAVNMPVGIVYDEDGQVTETLLGTGSSGDCLNNAVYGGLDNFAANGTFSHALVILNGMCVQDSSQLTDFEYRLVRVLGHVLGLDASQANLNVWTGLPVPTAADFAGFPVMHAIDLVDCLPITNCLPTPDQPTMDDRAALGRLYPVTAANQANFPTKSLFSASTVRIHGVVSFPGAAGPGQGMQGVNVEARWINPATFQPSRTYVASAVSGFLYHGNIGNPVTGWTDASGQNFDRWGSDDPSVQGFFDLAGLEIPNGDLTASYQLTFERVDPLYSEMVGSYAPLQVDPSGASPAVVVTVFQGLGTDVEQDIVMTNAAQVPANPPDSQDFVNPVPVPGGGEWMSWLTAVGGTNYYSLTAQANRTLSVEVATVDEQGNPTQGKAQPVMGIWSIAAPEGTPPPSSTPNPFNTTLLGFSRLDAQVLSSSGFRIGISDWRGDGRPDYAHHIRVLYADAITPARASAAGGTALQVQGMGFRPAMTALVGGVSASVVDFGANQLVLQTPALADGVETVVVSDPATGGFSTMTDSVTVGAGPSDTIQLLPVANPAIPVGGETLNPLPFLATAADGTPVAGATVALSTTNGLTLDPCGGATSCSVLSNESGGVVVNVGFTQPGTGQVTAQLAPASYANPSTAVATLTGVSSNLDIALVGQLTKVEQGTIVTVPLLARVLSPSGPQPGVQVNFQIAAGGSGVLGAASVVTDANGKAPNTLLLAPVSTGVQVIACVAPTNNPCKTFVVNSVPVSALQIEAVSGTQQVITEREPVLPVTVLVTDNSIPPYPVFGATVTFLNILSRSQTNAPVTVIDGQGNPNSDPVILGSVTTVGASDANGLAVIAPWATPVLAGEEINGTATVDSGAQVPFSLQVLAAAVAAPGRAGAAASNPVLQRLPISHVAPASRSVGGFFGLFTDLFTGAIAEKSAETPDDPLDAPHEDGLREADGPENLPEIPEPRIFENVGNKSREPAATPPSGETEDRVAHPALRPNDAAPAEKPAGSACERCSGAACSEILAGK